MTNDELKALCESNARAIAALTSEAREERQQRSTNADEINTLLGAVSSNEVACRDLRQTVEALVASIGGGNQRFDILRAEAIADRQETERKSEAWQANFDTQMQVMRSQLLEMSRINHRLDNLEQAS